MRQRTLAERAVWGVALLLALVGGPTGPAGIVHLALDDDQACHLPVAFGDAIPAVSTGGAGLEGAGDHCGTCHGLCSLRYQTPPLGLKGHSAQPLELVAMGIVRWLDVATRLQLPARAPPSAHA